MLTKKKKIIVLCSMLALLVITGFLNFTLNSSDEAGGGALTSQNFFAAFKAERTENRNTQLAILDSIIDSNTASVESRSQAEAKKLAILDAMEFERVTEGMISAKGFSDVVVSNSNNNINIIVKCQSLTSAEVAGIVQIIQANGNNVDIDNITVTPVY